jgi:iron complex transport system substrate-binding protein
LASRPRIISLEPNALVDIWEDMRRVAAGAGIDAEERIEGLLKQMKAQVKTRSVRPRVACIEWLEPLMAAGNWVPELVEMAGGVNLFGAAGRHSPWMTWDELLAADPDVVIVMPCGLPIERTLGEMHWLTARPEFTNLRAEVWVVDGNQYFNRPGPRVVESLQILTAILHGEPAGRSFESSAYVRFTHAATCGQSS